MARPNIMTHTGYAMNGASPDTFGRREPQIHGTTVLSRVGPRVDGLRAMAAALAA
jgi:hypothetical protein